MKNIKGYDIAKSVGDTWGCRGIFWSPLDGIENPPARTLHTFGRYRKYGPIRPEDNVIQYEYDISALNKKRAIKIGAI